MATVHQISKFDIVELLESIGAAPAGAQGGVLEFLNEGNVAEIEITTPDLEGLDRMVYAPRSKLRRVEPQPA